MIILRMSLKKQRECEDVDWMELDQDGHCGGVF